MVEGARRGERALERLGNRGGQLGETFDRLNTRTNLLARAFGALIAVGITAFFSQAIVAAGNFETKMAEVSTLVDTAVFDMRRLETAILDQSRAFGSLPVEQAAAAYQIISAGAADAASATELLDASNRLAVGGVTDVATAADGLTSVLNAYGMAATEASDVSDVLFVGMRAGKTTIGELASSLGNVAPLAAQAGVGFDELVASIAALTKGGISTQQSVTGVRAILAAVVKPTQEASDMANRLGIEFNAAALQSQGFAGFMDSVVTATGGSSEAMAQLFGGVEALVPALALAGQAGVDMTDILEDMAERGGATQEAFDAMTNTFEFQAARLRVSLLTALIELGTIITTSLTPAIRFLADNFDTLAAAAATLATVVTGRLVVALGTRLVAAITASIGQVVALELALGAATTRAALVSGGIKAVTLAFRGLTIAMAANPIGLLLTVLSTAAAAMFFFRDATGDASLATDNNSLAIADEIANINALNSLLDTGVQMTVSQAEAKLSEAESRRANILSLIEERDQMVQNSNAAIASSEQLTRLYEARDSLAAPGTDLEQMNSRIRESYEQIEQQIVEILSGMQALPSASSEYSQALEDNEANIEQIREALASARNGMVNLNGEAITGVDLSDRLSAGMRSAGDRAWEASYGTGALAQSLNVAAQAAAVLLANLGGVPSAIAQLAGQADSMVQSLVRQNATLNYQVEQGLSAQAAGIKAARDQAVQLALENGATIDEVAALGAAFDQQVARAEELARQNGTFTQTLRDMTDAATGGGGGAAGALNELAEAQNEYIEGLTDEYERIQQNTGGAREAVQAWYQEQLVILEDLGLRYEDFAVMLEAIFNERMAEAREQDLANATDWVSGIQRAMDSIEEDLGTAADRTEKLFKSAFDKSADALADFVMTGKLDFGELARSIIADIIKMQTRLLLFNALKMAFPGFAGGGMVPEFADGGMVPEFADGGKIRGAGTGRSDSILARVSNGEYIVNAKATRQYLPVLNQINEGRVPTFADGGLAGLKIPSFADGGLAMSSLAPTAAQESGDSRGNGRGEPTMIFNIQTNDAESFRKSEAQIANRMRRVAQRGVRSA